MMTTSEDSNIVRLRWALQALCRPAQEQLALYPEFVCPGDELVLEFDDYYRQVGKERAVGDRGYEALSALDSFLTAHSGDFFSHLYLDAKGLNEPEWSEIRSLAKTALKAIGWPDDMPPKERGDVWVGPPAK